MKPLFSIVLPTYNRASVLLDSVLILQNQTYSDWELIIVDDSSQTFEDSIKKLNDPRVFYWNRGARLGVSSARNFGAQHANGNYLLFLDDDDRVSPNWLSDFSSLAEINHYPDLLFCGMEIKDEVKKTTRIFYPGVERDLWNFIIPGCWAVSKVFFDRLYGYDERFLFGENTELFFRIRANEPTRAVTDTVNFFYNPSINGGSRNIQNRIDSTLILLDKHKELIQEDSKLEHVLIQVVGVCFLRLAKFSDAQKCLSRAYLLRPFNVVTLLRLIISYFPFFARRIYRPIG